MNVSGSSVFTSIYRQHLLNPDLRPQKPTDTEQKPENKPSVDGSVRPDGTEKPNNTSSLPDKVFAEIQELAKKDAKKRTSWTRIPMAHISKNTRYRITFPLTAVSS